MKIKIKNKNKDFENKILKVFQEIRFLAKIKGEYIVDYNHSWVEVNLKDEKNKERKKTNFLTEKDFDFKNCEINDFNEQDETDDIIFYEAENSDKNIQNSEKRFHFNKRSNKNKYLKKEHNHRYKKKNSSNSLLNFYPENVHLERNSNSFIEESRGNTKTDSSSEYSYGSSSRNISFDRNNNSFSDLYNFRDKFDKKSKKKFFIDISDDEKNLDFDEKFDRNSKKKNKKFCMNFPAFQENIKKKAFAQRKSTICIKNKEYLYESLFLHKCFKLFNLIL